ncbi:recombinase family protein [Microbacterium sp. LWS13-1.2]|uniref:Recombinase family protein n=1 Tax=Microbacterium sp. LWS13-1.2 TaxID=3135264 RepID=A0AAU6SGP1_9MICO
MTKRAALYLRLSAIAEDSSSIAAQEATLRAMADREGWTIDPADVLVDEGISGRKARDKAVEAVRRLDAGEVDVLAVYKLDRLSREGAPALGPLLAAVAKPGRLFVTSDGQRSDNPSFRLTLTMLAEVALMEAENTAARMRTAVAHRHTVGKHTGGPAPLGYRTAPHPDGGKLLVIDDAEAALIRASAERLLAGEVGVAGLARELQRDGVPTAKSPARLARLAGEPWDHLDRGVWDATTVRRLLTSDRITGRVTHHGRLVLDAEGLPAQHYPAVLEPATVEAIRAAVAPSSRPKPTARPVRVLSGIAFCGACNGKLWAGTGNRGHVVYRCMGRGCSTPAHILADPLEAFVAEEYLSVAGAWPEVRVVETVDTTTANELADVEAALKDVRAAQATAEDDEDDDALAALSERSAALRARRKALQARSTETRVETFPTGRTLGEAWHADDDVEERRLALGRALDSVLVQPGGARRGRAGGVDLSRVSIQWRPSHDQLGADEGESRGPGDPAKRRAPRRSASA